MRHLHRIAALAALSLLAACAGVTLVDPAKLAAVGNGVTVMPQVKWNQIKLDSDQLLWTQNGINLDQLRFITGIKAGKPLFPILGMSVKELAVFDAHMLPNDVQDLVVGAMEKQGYQNVRPGNLAPCPFGSTGGFCFELSFVSADGLEMKGTVRARKQADTLDLFEFVAPSEYYFGALSPTVSKVFASIETK